VRRRDLLQPRDRHRRPGHDAGRRAPLGVESFEAEAIKRAGDEREAEVSAPSRPCSRTWTARSRSSLDYVENHEGLRVEEILLSGGGVLAPAP
jgi:hypothetical protein